MNNCRLIHMLVFIVSATAVILAATNDLKPVAAVESTYNARWRIIDSLEDNGLTQSALDSVEKVYKAAKGAGNADQTVKAVIYRMKLASFKEEDAFVKTIERLNDEIKDSKFPVTPVLHSMLAECYRHYYQNNRWRFMERTQTADFEMKDLRTWDLKTIMNAMAEEYRLSLVDVDALKKTKLNLYDEVIGERTSDGAKLRPSLYDFLMHRVIDFYSLDDNDLPRPSFEFTLNNEDYFMPFGALSRLKIATQDTASLKFKAVKLMQDLISFHASDNAPDALIDVDLKRLAFMHEHAVVPGKDSLYLKALQALEKQFPASSASSEVTFAITLLYRQWAQTYAPRQDDRYRWMNRQALVMCEKAQKSFPKSYGAQQCAALAGEIKTKSMGFTIEEVNVPGKPFKALLTCRNVQKVYWREVKIDREEYNRIISRNHGDSLVMKLAKYKPVREWVVDFPDAGDCQTHSAEVEIPALPSGHYVVLAGSDSQFKYNGQAVAYASMQVSGISFIDRTKTGGGHEFHVLDRVSGAPLKGATVKAWMRVYDEKARDYRRVLHGTYTTDDQGYAIVVPTGKNYESCSMEFVDGNDRLLSGGEYTLYRHGKPDKPMQLRAFFFTDRAIYRPGQTVYFKGVMLRTDGEVSEVAAGVSTTVRFYNVNGQEVAHLDLAANKYGSVQGTFTTPTNSLNGQMWISDGHGSVYFSVEDYKRPKFEVTMNPFKGTARLGDSVKMEGAAKAYAGSAIDGAKVKYRVVRTARFPDWWWCWWRPSRWSAEMEITSGFATTNDTGGFAVAFKAIADQSIPRNEQPVFNYQVFADVTDMNGETRSATGSVSIGYVSLTLDVGIGQKVNRNTDTAFTITTANLNGTFEPAIGKISIWKIKSGERLVRRRLWEQPDTALMTKAQHDAAFPTDQYADETDMTKWPKEKRVYDGGFNTDKDKNLHLSEISSWNQGAYVMEAVTKDQHGQDVTAVLFFTLFMDFQKPSTFPFSSSSPLPLPYSLPDWFVPIKTTCKPGEKAVFLIGTGYDNTSVLYEIEHKGEIVTKEWIKLDKSQKRIEIPVEEKHRGNVSVHFTFVKDNRSYRHDETITVPWSNKELNISFETFRSKLAPGEKESWKIKITGEAKDKVAAEMVAALYDASLDAFRPHNWDFSIYPSYGVNRSWSAHAGFGLDQARIYEDDWNDHPSASSREYPYLNWFGYEFQGGYERYGYGGGMMKDRMVSAEEARPMPRRAMMAVSAASPAAAPEMSKSQSLGKAKIDASFDAAMLSSSAEPSEKKLSSDIRQKPSEDLSKITTRTNLNETAFFFPLLQTNENGEIIISFQIPEALTKWKMLGFAHTQDLKFGQITNELVTQKDLMVMPNPPRFFRENDTIVFTAKVSNLADKDLSGTAQLMLFDAATNKPVDTIFMNNTAQVRFIAKKGQSAPLAWNLVIPEGIGAVTFKVVAKAGTFSDGEEQIIPVLSNRMLVTESMPLPIRKKETKKVTFEKLVSGNNGSTTLRNHKLTLEFTSNPAWYAIQALPYMMEYPYECAEQTFARFYANSIASYISNSSPRIKAVFDHWRTVSPDALLSNLEKNQELKSLVLEETPWLIDGKDESERKKRVGLLFDLNKMGNERDRALTKLKRQQLSNGGWPWFEGMPDDRYITQYIAIGMGRLDHLGMIGLRKDGRLWDMMQRCLRYLDDRVREDYEDIIRHSTSPDSNHLGEIHIQYLYTRSYFKDVAVAGNNKKAFEYFTGQAKKYWLRNSRYMQGMIALALERQGDKVIPGTIMRSLKENAVTSEEMGMYWKEMYEQQGYWWWYQAPIETQALMVEAFDEVAHDTVAVEDLKAWLLKSKQTQNWETTRATAEACYALLLRGTKWRDKPSTVNITLGDVSIDAADPKDAAVEAGTGYFKTSWSGSDVKPDMGNITVTKGEAGVAWGAVYWQYFEQLDRITPHETPLKLIKKLFLQESTPTGLRISPIAGNTTLRPGDKLTVRIELRVDRDMEYVHMKDMRASGFEPLNVFSGYRRQDGLGYYESTRDAATNFFFGSLRKGTYVFEYPLVVSHAGDFSGGITTIQCMYAPEFTSHSEGVRVKVIP